MAVPTLGSLPGPSPLLRMPFLLTRASLHLLLLGLSQHASAQAARPERLKQQKFRVSSSGGRKSEVKVPAGLTSPEVCLLALQTAALTRPCLCVSSLSFTQGHWSHRVRAPLTIFLKTPSPNTISFCGAGGRGFNMWI